ncbi:MAG TPA: hypothetical protein VNI55_01790 [Gaiellaceae bacterium]|nr:hypothetical protein [Gaiellaceae bacterium]
MSEIVPEAVVEADGAFVSEAGFADEAAAAAAFTETETVAPDAAAEAPAEMSVAPEEQSALNEFFAQALDPEGPDFEENISTTIELIQTGVLTVNDDGEIVPGPAAFDESAIVDPAADPAAVEFAPLESEPLGSAEIQFVATQADGMIVRLAGDTDRAALNERAEALLDPVRDATGLSGAELVERVIRIAADDLREPADEAAVAQRMLKLAAAGLPPLVAPPSGAPHRKTTKREASLAARRAEQAAEESVRRERLASLDPDEDGLTEIEALERVLARRAS